MQKEEKKPALLTWEVEGKKETYVVAHDPIIENVQYNRFDFVQNATEHTANIQAILAMKGQNCLIPKAKWDLEQKERSMGIYPWNKKKGGSQ